MIFKLNLSCSKQLIHSAIFNYCFRCRKDAEDVPTLVLQLAASAAKTGRENWTATLSVITDPPRDAETLHRNPLGLYVHGINWSKDLN